MKIVCYERYLQKKAAKDKEAATLLYKYQQTVFSESDEEDGEQIEDHKSQDESFKVSNVVDENIKLKRDLKAAFTEITRLQEKVQAGGAVGVKVGKDPEMFDDLKDDIG